MASMLIAEAEGRGLKVGACIGLDPGDSTGWVHITLDPAGLLNKRAGLMMAVRGGTCESGVEQVEHTGDLLIDEARTARVIAERAESFARWWAESHRSTVFLFIEDFVVRERTQDRSLLSPVRLTSGVLALLDVSRYSFVVELSSSSDAKNVITDSVLEDHDRWTNNRHVRDAMRQVLLGLRRHYA